MILFEVILPVFLLVLIGYIAQKTLQLNVKSISAFVLYLLFPALCFRTFYQAEINIDYLWIVIYSAVLTLSIIVLVKAVCAFKKYDKSVEAGLILSTAFMNNGNLGIPVILFAYGSAGFDYAVPIAVIHIVIMNIIGIYYAAKGSFGIRQALKETIKMPILYALCLALFFNLFTFSLPENILKVIYLAADAAVPSITIILGLQLATIRLQQIELGKISLALMFRLLVSPLLAYIIVSILPVDPFLGKIMIVAAAMPTAVITTLFAVQYDSRPGLVSSVTFFSTVISAGILPLLIKILD